jgi:hypothetical protein
MSEEVKFIRGNDRINRLAARPDIPAEVARGRASVAVVFAGFTMLDFQARTGVDLAVIVALRQALFPLAAM